MGSCFGGALGGGLTTSPEAEYVIVSETAALPAGLASEAQAAGGRVRETVPEIGVMVADASDPGFRAKMEAVAGVRSVFPNFELRVAGRQKGPDIQPGEPPGSAQDDQFYDLKWDHSAMDVPAAWGAGARGAGTRVAVLDTYVDVDHPDLDENVDEALAKSFYPGEPYERGGGPYLQHGTGVAGTIAAEDNAEGVIGVAPEAEILPVKMVGEFDGNYNQTSSYIVAEALVYAANQGSDVINMSFIATSGPARPFCDGDRCYTAREVADFYEENYFVLQRATGYAHAKGSTLVAGAGNSAYDYDANLGKQWLLPQQLPHVINVSATAPKGWSKDQGVDLDTAAPYTNFGVTAVDLAAPGGQWDFSLEGDCTVAGSTQPCWAFDGIWTTQTYGGVAGYFADQGTSFAAPQASGVAALMIGERGDSMAPSLVESKLKSSSDDLGPRGPDDYCFCWLILGSLRCGVRLAPASGALHT